MSTGEVLFAPNRPRGEAHYDHRLTEAQVHEIRASAVSVSQKELAHRFSVSHVAIWKIIHRKSWKHL
jgi:DNA-binding transcriptional regulator YiaG